MIKQLVIDGIVGTRPNMMKMAPFARAVEADGRFKLRLIHTGQHYDEKMSDIFFSELGLPPPAFNLKVGAGPHGEQTARILSGYESILMHEPRPHGVVVVGDVTSTMACTLAAVKLGLPVAHIEAGLRSGDRSMPEEINRIVTDALADLLFVSDPDGLWHLAHEGRPREQTWLVGNIMMDTLYNELKAAEQSTILQTLRLQAGAYAFMTLHRPSNVDTPQHLQQIVSTIQELSYDLPVVFAVHPRTRERISSLKSTTLGTEKFRLIEPLGYRENLCMMKNARMVISDSGGIQEETTVLNVPCLTLRENTERPITVELGSSELVGNDPAKIREAWYRALNGKWKITSSIPLWDGRTAERIVSQLGKQWL